MEIQGNIRVICRIRPILEVEKRSSESAVDVTTCPPGSTDEVVIQRDTQTRTKYEYDRVFFPSATQSHVFEAIQPLCVSVLDGYNVCIFAYGQTGSGKTFTMQGGCEPEDLGMSPRAINELFKQISALSDWNFTLTFSMLVLTHSPKHLLTHSPNHLLTHSPNHLTIYSLTHLTIYSLTRRYTTKPSWISWIVRHRRKNSTFARLPKATWSLRDSSRRVWSHPSKSPS